MNIFFPQANETLNVVKAEYESSYAVLLTLDNNNTYTVYTDPNNWAFHQGDYDALVLSGIFIIPLKPSVNHVWDEVNLVWVLDQGLFTPYLFDALDEHLTTLLESRHLYVVDSVNAYFKNDSQTCQAISDYVDDKDAVNDPLYSVEFKARDANEEPLWVTLNGAEIQGLKHSLTTRMKNAFIALKAVQTQHGVTPYTDVQSALDDFDTQFGGL